MSEKDRRKSIILLLTAVVTVSAVALMCVGKPLIRFVSDADAFRAFVEKNSWWSRVAFLGMLVFQVVFAIIPGGAFEVAGGYAFGAAEGTILSVVGTTLGSILVFLLVRRWGLRYVLLFFTREQLASAKFMHDEKRLYLIAFIAFIIPGTPKDLLEPLDCHHIRCPYSCYFNFDGRRKCHRYQELCFCCCSICNYRDHQRCWRPDLQAYHKRKRYRYR